MILRARSRLSPTPTPASDSRPRRRSPRRAPRSGELTSTGHREIDITCNVADEAQVAAMVKRAVAWPTHVPSEVSTCFFCRTGPRLALRKAKKNKSNVMSEHLEIHLKGMMHHMQHHVLYPFAFGKLNLPETSAFTAESVR